MTLPRLRLCLVGLVVGLWWCGFPALGETSGKPTKTTSSAKSTPKKNAADKKRPSNKPKTSVGPNATVGKPITPPVPPPLKPAPSLGSSTGIVTGYSPSPTRPAGTPGTVTAGPSAALFPVAPSPYLSGGAAAAEDLQRAALNLDRSRRNHELDELIDRTARLYPNDWRVLFQAARVMSEADRSGYLVEGRFRRGEFLGEPPKGAAKVYSRRRDHVHALQLLQQALAASRNEIDIKALADFHWEAAQILTGYRGYLGLYHLTDLKVLPPLDTREPEPPAREPVPVDEKGEPVFFSLPASWEEARNDGERLLWLLSRAQSLSPEYAAETEFIRDKYLLRDYLGIESITESRDFDPYQKLFRRDPGAQQLLDQAHTLTDDETICRLITGVRRIKLPPEQNFLKRFQAMTTDARYHSHAEEATEQLAEIHENRRQYRKAAKYWEDDVTRFTPGQPAWETERLAQINQNWGKLEETRPFQSDEKVSLGFWYRNAEAAEFTAYRVDVSLLLADLLAYLRSDPFPLQIDRIQLSRLGRLLVRSVADDQPETPVALVASKAKPPANGAVDPANTPPQPPARPPYDRDGKDYLRGQVAQWSLPLPPVKDHWDGRVSVDAPLTQPGAYLVEAKARDGNTSTVIVWVNDLTIVRRRLEKGMFYYVADKRTGDPVSWAKFQFVGYKLDAIPQDAEPELDQHGAEIPEALRRQYHVLTKDVTKWADAKGQLVIGHEELPPDYQWFLLTTAPPGRVALLGFSDINPNVAQESRPESHGRHYLVLDREVYLPGQEVRFHGWIRERNSPPNSPPLLTPANADVEATVLDSNGREWGRKLLKTGQRGGLSGSFVAPSGDGAYALVTKLGSTVGRTEFRVASGGSSAAAIHIDPPASPVKRGEKFTINFRARLPSGEAAAGSRIYYYLQRRPWAKHWRPDESFDWMYGHGHGWTNLDTPWFPGWDSWGWPAPGKHSARTEPSLVAEGYLDLSRDGEAMLSLTAGSKGEKGLAEAEEYEITAKLVGDESTEATDAASLVVSDAPFKVHARMDRGYYHVGDEARFEAWARKFDGEPARASGELVIYGLSYDDKGLPSESPIARYTLSTDANGYVSQPLRATKTGQYRLVLTLADASGAKAQGATLRFVADESFRGDDCRFNFLELVTDKVRYQPGERVRLRVNTDRKDRNVALFVRPKQGVYGQAEVVKLDHKSTPYEIDVRPDDMPSFFVEAILLHQGRFEVFTKEILVEPPDPTGRLVARTDKSEFSPGEKTRIRLELKDSSGQPIAGEALIAIRPIGGAALADSRAFFWSNRQTYEPSVEYALTTSFEGYARPPDQAMKPIGLFGPVREAKPAANVDEDESAEEKSSQPAPGRKGSLAPTTWEAALEIPANGLIEKEISLPKEAGAWEARVWAMSDSSRIAETAISLRVREDSYLELVEPPYLVSGDETALQAKVGNYSAKPMTLALELQPGGPAEFGAPTNYKAALLLAPQARQTHSWPFRAGEVLVTAQASVALQADHEGRKQETRATVPIHPRVAMISQANLGRSHSREVRAPLEAPAPGGVISVRAASSLLGHLAPIALDWTPDAIPQAEEIAHRLTVATLLRRAGKSQAEAGKAGEPWFMDDQRFAAFLQRGLKSLEETRHQDGGWSFGRKREESSDPLVTAFVTRGLAAMKAAGADVPAKTFDQSLGALQAAGRQAVAKLSGGKKGAKPSAGTGDAILFWALNAAGNKADTLHPLVLKDWAKFANVGKVALGLALHQRAEVETRDKIRFFLGEKLVKNEAKEQLSLRPDAPSDLSLADADVLHALYLKFLVQTKGDNPVTDNLAAYVLDRRASLEGWPSSRATALCVEALLEYDALKMEPAPSPMELAVRFAEAPEPVAKLPLGGPWGGSVDLRSTLPAGKLDLLLQSTGASFYHCVTLTAPAAPDAGPPKILREYSKALTEEPPPGALITDAAPTAKRVPISGGVNVSDTVEVALTFETDRPCEQARLVDRLPACCAPDKASLQSQARLVHWDRSTGEVEFLIPSLPAGKHRFAYLARVALAGSFRALPARFSAAYPADLRAASEEATMLARPGPQ